MPYRFGGRLTPRRDWTIDGRRQRPAQSLLRSITGALASRAFRRGQALKAPQQLFLGHPVGGRGVLLPRWRGRWLVARRDHERRLAGFRLVDLDLFLHGVDVVFPEI